MANRETVLTMAVVRYPSVGVAIRYVLPVLWITSCFRITSSVKYKYPATIFFFFGLWFRVGSTVYNSTAVPARPNVTMEH